MSDMTKMDFKMHEPVTGLTDFMKNISELMDRLEDIQTKIGPLDFSKKEPGLKGALLKLFEACCPLSRNLTDEEMWEEHKKIRTLLFDDNIPKKCHVRDTLSQVNRNDAIDQMLQWAAANGADVAKVQVRNHGNAFKLVAAQKLEAREPFLTLPNTIVMSSDGFLKHEAIEYIVSHDLVLSSMQSVLMAYGLLVEFYRGQESAFWPYLQCLPESYNNAYYFDLEEMKLLENSLSFRDSLSAWKSTVRQYAFFHLKLLGHLSFGDEVVIERIKKYRLEELFCYEDFRWAAATVASRSITIKAPSVSGCNHILAPILDLCNHAETISFVNLDPVDHVVKACSGFTIEKESEVTTFYGARTCSHFVIHYGFHFGHIPHEFVMFRLPFDRSTPLNVEKHNILIKMGLTEYHGFPVGVNRDKTWSGELIAYMRVYVANQEDISVLQALGLEDLRKKLYDSTPISQLNEDEALAQFIRVLKETIQRYDSSVEEDEKIAGTPEASKKIKNIVSLKKTELETLKTVLARLSGDENEQK